jgi:hypothetical protein
MFIVYQMIERITPPSTRSAAPLVAAESGLAMNVISAATSSVEAKRLSKEAVCSVEPSVIHCGKTGIPVFILFLLP